MNDPDRQVVIAAKQALDVYHNLDLVESAVDAIIADPKISYIIHRLRDFTDQKIPLKKIKDLDLPMWVEMLLNEILVINRDKKS